MIFRIVTKHGVSVDVANLPADFNLQVVWANIRLTGQFQNESLVVPLDSISYLIYGDVAVSGQNAPTTGTKQ